MNVLFIISSVFGIAGGVISAPNSIMSLVKLVKGTTPDSVKLHTTVRVAVGLNNHLNASNPLEGAEGPAPMIVAFNENQDYVGNTIYHHNKKMINNGGFQDLLVTHKKKSESEQTTHLQILGQSDPICIAYITETWPDETRRGWLGDMGAACGYEWGYSNVIVGEHYKPHCTWIGGNHTNDIYTMGLQIHMEDFTNSTESYSNDTKSYCELPKMLFMDEHQYNLKDDFRSHELNKKGPRKQQLWTGQKKPHVLPQTNGTVVDKRDRHAALARRSPGQLVTSSDQQHSARVACNSPGFRGPDIISLHEGMFCDTETKTLWPLCGKTASTTEVTDGCFDRERSALVNDGKHYVRSYDRVEEWE